MRNRLVALGVLALALAAAPPALAVDQIYGVTTASPPHLVSFESSTPGTFTTDVAINGLVAGDEVLGLDMRPADGQLYLLTRNAGTGRLWTVNAATGVASNPVVLVPDPSDASVPYAGMTAANGVGVGVDFNPVNDRLRIVTTEDANMRVHPGNGEVFTDGAINGGGAIAGVAYDRNDRSTLTGTTLFAYDFQADDFGNLNPPNLGTFNVVGANPGVTSTTEKQMSIDVAQSGAVYAVHRISSPTEQRLYGIDAATGVHAVLGTLPVTLLGLTAAPNNVIAVDAPAISAGEAAGVARVTVTRRNPLGAIDVSYATGGGATAGSDYTALAGTLTFAAGQATRTIDVPLTNDTADEADETFEIALSLAATAEGYLRESETAVTIVDDDTDRDGDGVADATDNCAQAANADQADGNANGLGTACDAAEAPVPSPDRDSDGKADATDNCPNVANADQGDGDGDGLGTVCDPAEAVARIAGRCANERQGTAADDGLVGLGDGDRLSGLGGDDSLFGADGDDCLLGAAGEDWLSGGDGADELRGGTGDDVVNGGAGNDTLFGDAGNDRMVGGTGNDTIDAGRGTNVVRAGAGNDTIRARNGRAETIDCGAGRDTVTADARDRLRGCEGRRR